MKQTIQLNTTYRLGKNIVKVLLIDGHDVIVKLNGVNHYTWLKVEMDELLNEGQLETLFDE